MKPFYTFLNYILQQNKKKNSKTKQISINGIVYSREISQEKNKYMLISTPPVVDNLIFANSIKQVMLLHQHITVFENSFDKFHYTADLEISSKLKKRDNAEARLHVYFDDNNQITKVKFTSTNTATHNWLNQLNPAEQKYFTEYACDVIDKIIPALDKMHQKNVTELQQKYKKCSDTLHDKLFTDSNNIEDNRKNLQETVEILQLLISLGAKNFMRTLKFYKVFQEGYENISRRVQEQRHAEPIANESDSKIESERKAQVKFDIPEESTLTRVSNKISKSPRKKSPRKNKQNYIYELCDEITTKFINTVHFILENTDYDCENNTVDDSYILNNADRIIKSRRKNFSSQESEVEFILNFNDQVDDLLQSVTTLSLTNDPYELSNIIFKITTSYTETLIKLRDIYASLTLSELIKTFNLELAIKLKDFQSLLTNKFVNDLVLNDNAEALHILLNIRPILDDINQIQITVNDNIGAEPLICAAFRAQAYDCFKMLNETLNYKIDLFAPYRYELTYNDVALKDTFPVLHAVMSEDQSGDFIEIIRSKFLTLQMVKELITLFTAKLKYARTQNHYDYINNCIANYESIYEGIIKVSMRFGVQNKSELAEAIESIFDVCQKYGEINKSVIQNIYQRSLQAFDYAKNIHFEYNAPVTQLLHLAIRLKNELKRLDETEDKMDCGPTKGILNERVENLRHEVYILINRFEERYKDIEPQLNDFTNQIKIPQTKIKTENETEQKIFNELNELENLTRTFSFCGAINVDMRIDEQMHTPTEKILSTNPGV